ncbi:hypothetical protein L5515_001199 [Caenorhabditis briggsae]|uniref:Tudor domain-containing protein n=3 Tax=Caenorhabditis briggsae TaxID=6238 RepID=A0AAE9E0S6_CAEBR|nr:hypothetical protein L5515_001199 [Caenorhabditis briggsae]
MISVGIRLTDQVFPGPEEPIAVFPGGTENPKQILDGIDKEGVAHIKRIILNRTANVEFLRAESPSRIWVRLQNHITDTTLTFREPFPLKSKLEIRKDGYALAPIDERVYRRCRIIETENENGLIQIFFIDDATTAWVKSECLAIMDEHYMFYPWQAIQISMFGVYPSVVDHSGKLEQLWSIQTCNKLSQILRAFPILRVQVALSTVVFNDYAKPIPVKLFGIPPGVEEREYHYRAMSISQILEGGLPMPAEPEEEAKDDVDSDEEEVLETGPSVRKEEVDNKPPEIVCMDLYDAAFHEIFDVAERDQIPTEPLDIHCEFPKDWKESDDAEEEEKKEKEEELYSKDSLTVKLEHADWDPRLNKIEMMTVKELGEKFRFSEDDKEPRIMLAVEGRCTKSPYEWYARPIVKTGKNKREENVAWGTDSDLREVDETDWMLYGNDQLTSVAEQLDTFYSNTKNRKPLRTVEIQAMMQEKRDVFAVCAVNEEKANYTGEWQRVLIVNCDQFAEVRFLDSGGRDMVLTSSLYRIHEQHCRFPPMCLRFAIHGVSTRLNSGREDGKWHSNEIARFRMCLREDTPIFINIADIVPLPAPMDKERRVHMARHVLMAKDVSYMDETRSLLDRFLNDEDSVNAVRNPELPSQWPPF